MTNTQTNISGFSGLNNPLDVVEDEIHWHGCNAGDTIFGIEADGTIKSCPGLANAYAGGNIRDRRLREIWETSEPIAVTIPVRQAAAWAAEYVLAPPGDGEALEVFTLEKLLHDERRAAVFGADVEDVDHVGMAHEVRRAGCPSASSPG